MALIRGLIRGVSRGLKRGLGSSIGGRQSIVAVTAADENDSVDRTVYNAFVEAVTPPSGKLLLMAVLCTHTTTAESPSSVTAYGLTWTAVPGAAVSHAGGARRITWLYAWGTPVNGTPTITFATGHLSCSYSVLVMHGASMVAPLQTATNSGTGTTITVTLPGAFENAKNVHIYALSRVANEDSVPPAAGGWVELTDIASTAPAGRLQVAYAANDNTADPTWATSGGAGIVGLEIKAA